MTTAAVNGDVILRDVTLRDGVQLTGKVLATEHKVEIVRTLLEVGAPEVEIGSMARPDLVPPMANSLDVVAALEPVELERCWIWVATAKHVERASAAGVRNFQYCLSASDAHNRANLGRDTETSLNAMPDAVDLARRCGGKIQLCIATAFTCPFKGEVAAERVPSIVDDPGRRESTTWCSQTRSVRPYRRKSLRWSPPCTPGYLTAASCFTATTPGVWASPTHWPRWPRALLSWTERLAVWVVARSHQVRVETLPVRISCSPPDRPI